MVRGLDEGEAQFLVALIGEIHTQSEVAKLEPSDSSLLTFFVTVPTFEKLALTQEWGNPSWYTSQMFMADWDPVARFESATATIETAPSAQNSPRASGLNKQN